MTKEDIIEILDKYDSDFMLNTGELIQAIYFYDFGKLADELLKALEAEKLTTPDATEQSEQSISARLSSSLGKCIEGNDYEIIADKDGRFWINHKQVGSGEPLEQWINSVLNLKTT